MTRPSATPLTPEPAGAEPGAASAAIDASVLDKLRELDPTGRAGIVPRVLRTYEASLAKLMGQFAQARAGGDAAGLRHVAHTLRSSSASIGALALAARCGELEALIREGRSDGLEAMTEALAGEAGRVGEAVRAILAAQGPAA